MWKIFSRQLFAQLSRRLPRRLVQRDPMPAGKSLASGPIPDSLARHCLNVAAMDENEIWRAFNSHPEGLTAMEVEEHREQYGENTLPAQKPASWWVHLWQCYRNPKRRRVIQWLTVAMFSRPPTSSINLSMSC
ncbi:hypothetical protein GM30_02270 [Trabulsiella odontotermitis]|nr:hypothetical protein GM30_02270 [Trabulsiella odontotermitis]